ncbi:MAG: TetR/AcrR family transcriptional regulator [Actinomycetota bacterium]
MTDTSRRTRSVNARGQATRRRIERVALELFDRDGVDATSVDVIAERAGVARRTFFHHFSSKYDVVAGDLDAELARFSACLFESDELDLRAALVDAIARHAQERPFDDVDLLRFRVVRAGGMSAEATAGWEAAFCTLIGEWLAHRCHASTGDLEVRAVAAALVGMRRVVVETWAGSGGRADVAELARTALAAISIDIPPTDP